MFKLLKINTFLNHLWGTVIEKFNINMKEHTIDLSIKSVNEGKETIIDIVLKDVISFCWINDSFNQDNDRRDLEKWNFISLESAQILSKSIVNVEGLENNFFATPNVLFELWNSVFLVEAKSIVINGETFELIQE